MITYPTEKSENYTRSFWNYVEGRYTLTEKFLQGMNTLDTTKLQTWAEFAFEDTSRVEIRLINQSNPGNLVTRTVYASLFAKADDRITQIASIRDAIIPLLRRVVIPVRDWVGGGAVIDQMEGQGVFIDTPLPSNNEIDGHILGFRFTCREEFARYHS